MLEKYLALIKAHERIIIVAILMGFGVYGFNHWVDRSAANADAKTQAAVQAAATADATSKALAAQSAAQQAQFAQQLTAEQQQIASITAAIVSRDAAAKTQIAKVTASTTPTLAVVDLSTEYTLPVPVAVTADGADVPTQDLQLFTATKIDDVTAQSDLLDTKSELTGTQSVLMSCQTTVVDLQKQVTQDGTDLKAHDTAAAAELKQAKDDARKSKWHWFLAGFVSGFLGRSAIK